MSYIVSPRSLSIMLNESNAVKSVIQNVAIILSTRQQTVPLYRDFGLPMQFIDKPMAVAKPLLISEITDAISAYEPRAEVVNVTFEIDDNAPGKLIPIVEIEVNTNE